MCSKVKNLNVKLFEVNETRFLVQHESGECKFRLNENVCDSKQNYNPDEYSYGCKEFDD